MKKLFLTATISFSIIFSTNCVAEWKLISQNLKGTKFFVETSSIKNREDYTYYWMLYSHSKPVLGDFSNRSLYQTDCKEPLKQKILDGAYFDGLMANGKMTTRLSQKYLAKAGFEYAPPGSVLEKLLSFVCNLK